MLRYLQNHPALPRADRFSPLAGLESKCLLLQNRGQRAAAELPQVAARSRRRPFAKAARQLRKVAARVKPRLNVVGLGFGSRIFAGSSAPFASAGPVEIRISLNRSLSGC